MKKLVHCDGENIRFVVNGQVEYECDDYCRVSECLEAFIKAFDLAKHIKVVSDNEIYALLREDV